MALQYGNTQDNIHTRTQRTLMRVCKIGRAQGLKGEVNVMVTTDSPEQRFAPGSVLLTHDGKSMRVVSSRKFKQRWILRFEGVDNRNASEALQGIELFVEPDHAIVRTPQGQLQEQHQEQQRSRQLGQDSTQHVAGTVGIAGADAADDEILDDFTDHDTYDDEDDGFYAEELLNLQVRIPQNADDPDGAYDPAGVVIDVTESPAQWLLTVREPSGAESLVPFVDAFIPVIDVEAGYLVLTPPKGLLQDR